MVGVLVPISQLDPIETADGSEEMAVVKAGISKRLAVDKVVDLIVSVLTDSAPTTLDTLNELAAALGDDPNFAATVTTALGNRLRVDTNAQGLNGTQQANAKTNLNLHALATSGNADDIVESSTKKVLTSAERTKLAGIATAATANSADAFLLARGNHTGQQSSGTISDFTEAVQDIVASFLVQGTNVTFTHDDASNTFTISASGGGGSGDASTVPFAPAGNVQATNVQTAIQELDNEKLKAGVTSIGAGVSANTAVQQGFYVVSNTALNIPAAFFGFMLVFYDGTNGKQIWYAIGSNLVYTRDNSGGSFGSWARVDSGDKLPLVGGSLTGTLSLAHDFPQFRWGTGNNAWRAVKDTTQGVAGNLVFQHSSDNFSANFVDALHIAADGTVTLGSAIANKPSRSPAGHIPVRSVLLAQGFDLNTLSDEGSYTVNAPTNGPFAMTNGQFCYVRHQRYNASSDYWYQELTIMNVGLPNNRPYSWCRKLTAAGNYSDWVPMGFKGQVTPGHFGLSPSDTAGGAQTNNAALQLWLDSKFPKYVDAWYGVGASLTTSLASRNGFTMEGAGAGVSGFLFNAGAEFIINGADVDNPVGFVQDTVTIRDFSILVNTTSVTQVLTISFADSDSGSAIPTLTLENFNILPTATSVGFTGSGIRLRNVRNRMIRNVSIHGRYGQYGGYGIEDLVGVSSAPVHCHHIGVNIYHVAKGHVITAAEGAVQYDDAQGYNWFACNTLAVNRGYELIGNADLFMDAFNWTNCHVLFREVGIYATDTRQCMITACNFLGWTNAFSTMQGICLTTTNNTISMRHKIRDNDIRLDGLTAATRYGLNIVGGNCRGVRGGNEVSGATTAFIIPATMVDGGGNQAY